MEKTYKEIINEKMRVAKTKEELNQIRDEVFENLTSEMNRKKDIVQQAIKDYKETACECHYLLSTVTMSICVRSAWDELHLLVDPQLGN